MAKKKAVVSPAMFGRKLILTDEKEINDGNVVGIVRNAYINHLINRNQIDYLYRYYRGEQPILVRTKPVRPEICNKIVENRAHQIVDFKTGYLVGEPIQYTSRGTDEGIADKLNVLNSFMYSESKATRDKELVDWMNICGTSYRFVLPSDDAKSESPFNIYTLDPRDTFIIYSNDVYRRKLASVHYVTDQNGNRTFYIYTTKRFYEIQGEKLTRVEDNRLEMIPIIEYPANESRIGVFETVLSLLDAVNNLDSNRLDGVEQAIQTLLVLYNCQLEEGTTASDIRESGLMMLKQMGELKSDIKELTSKLDQQQTQTLKQDLINAIVTIVGMPSQGDGNSSDSSNNGAMLLKQGWQTAEARAKDSELIFKNSEIEMLKVVLSIVSGIGLFNLKASDIAIKFTRRNYEAIAEKATVLTQLIGCGWVDLVDAFTVTGMFIEPEEAARRGQAWHERNAIVEQPPIIEDVIAE